MKTILTLLLVAMLSVACAKKSTKNPAPMPICSVTPTTIGFGNKLDTAFAITNTGQVTFSGYLSVRNEWPNGWRYFYIQSEKNYTLKPGESHTVELIFNPLWRPLNLLIRMEGTIETGQSACVDVYCSGY